MPIECPICKSTRTWKQRKLLRGKWIGCHSCGWEMSQEEFHERGGTHGIKTKNIKQVNSGKKRGEMPHGRNRNHKKSSDKNSSFLLIIIILIALFFGYSYFNQVEDNPNSQDINYPKGTNEPINTNPSTSIPVAIKEEYIECTKSDDCGKDGFVGERFCNEERIHQNFKLFECSIPGTTNSSCSSSTKERRIETCEYGCQEAVCLPRFKVTGSKTDVIINNNAREDILLNVTYHVFSEWFGKDSTSTQLFDVELKNEKSFTVYNNDGCFNAPCYVEIISSVEIK